MSPNSSHIFSRPDGANDYWKSEAVDAGQLDLFLSHSVLVLQGWEKSRDDDGRWGIHGTLRFGS